MSAMLQTDPELDDILWTHDNLRNLGIRRVLPLGASSLYCGTEMIARLSEFKWR